jgi:hypothetical protein
LPPHSHSHDHRHLSLRAVPRRMDDGQLTLARVDGVDVAAKPVVREREGI